MGRIMWTFTVLFLSALIVTEFKGAGAAPRARVRRELRTLNDTEWGWFSEALTIMINMPQAQGAATYGPSYRQYDYFVVKHAIAVLDPRGDQGHFGPSFITFHKAFLIEFENSILSIVPQLGAIPYWDVLMDVRGGLYPPTSVQSMFSSKYAGHLNPGGKDAYSPPDGAFSWRPIPVFDWDAYAPWADIFNGSLSTGLLRGPDSNTTNSYITRNPAPLPEFEYRFRQGGKSCFHSNARPNELALKYITSDWQLCFNASKIKTLMDWHWCTDMNAFEPSPANTPGIETTILSTCSYLLHPGPHYLVGGMDSDGAPGDMNDLATSPNEVLLFMLHHANIDRNFMIWQRAAARLDPYISDPSVMWHYPSDPSLYQDMEEPFSDGCYLYDTVNANMPFTDIFPGQAPSNPDGYTHFDVLWNTRPGAAPYSYDNLGIGRGKKATTKRAR